jgi:3-carboxy-cis,cis-muconate cycloisomerase
LRSSALFTAIFVPDAIRDAVGDRAWLQAMLDAERALAAAQAHVGVIPAEAAAAIAEACVAERFDAEAIGRAAAAGAGNPVPALVEALGEAAGADAGRYVHWGATSQDVIDTAAMLVARRALDLILADLDAVASACVALADDHRDTLMPGRTLLQQALPIPFGLKAAMWLSGVLEARDGLLAVRGGGLAVQLGGAAGTLASMGEHGVAVLGRFAAELGLAEPALPWHTNRARVAALGSALAVAAGALAKVALDVELMAQTEVGEVAEPGGGGRGGSSTMPHKRNPVGSTLARACALRVQGAAGVLLAAMAQQEHERAAGAWHAEWESLTDALAYTGGSAAAMRTALEGLEVRPERMRANLELTRGLLLAEHAMMELAERIGRGEAKRVVEAAAARATESGGELRDELAADAAVSEHLSAAEIDRALDPAGYLGSADAFIDRALERYRR